MQYILLCVVFTQRSVVRFTDAAKVAVSSQCCVVFRCADSGQLVHSPAGERADGFQFGAVTNKVAMNILLPVF